MIYIPPAWILQLSQVRNRDLVYMLGVAEYNIAEDIFEAQEQLWLDALPNTTNDFYGIRTHDLLITSHAFYHWAMAAPL